MHWAKVHPRVRYELTLSEVPHAVLGDIEAGVEDVGLEVEGTYGHPALIRAISKRYDFPEEGVIPVPGASSGNFIALAVAAGYGDTVLMEHPIYEPIARVASFLGLSAVSLLRRSETSFGVDPDDVQVALAAGAKAVVLTNLHNPTGQYLSPETIAEIAGRCTHSGAVLIVDEAYLDAAHLAGSRPLWTAANVASNVIAVNTLTKVYGLPGLRAGWMLAHGEMADRARTVMDLLSVCNAAPAASLAVRAFDRIELLEQRYRRFHQQGQRVFKRWLKGMPMIGGYENQGALFECLKLPDGITGDCLSDLLRTEYDTQVTPGSFFGLDDHIRLSIACPPKDLAEALARISRAIATLTS